MALQDDPLALLTRKLAGTDPTPVVQAGSPYVSPTTPPTVAPAEGGGVDVSKAYWANLEVVCDADVAITLVGRRPGESTFVAVDGFVGKEVEAPGLSMLALVSLYDEVYCLVPTPGGATNVAIVIAPCLGGAA